MTLSDEAPRADLPVTTAEPLWRWPALCRALALEVVAGPDVRGISIDSRSIQPGELFVALAGDPGPRFQSAAVSARDGHDFLGNAAARGAAGALISTSRADTHGATRTALIQDGSVLPSLQVTDTLDGLWALGRAGRLRSAARVVAVTGSSGKTTLKTMLGNALDAYASTGSFNNHLGVPLTLARLPVTANMAVVEIGTNHPGEIAPLAALARPHVAVVLNVLPAHIGNFPDMAALRTEKLSIASGLAPDGILVLPVELAAYCAWSGRRITFGAEAGDVRVRSAGDTATLRHDGEEWSVRVPGGGAHRALSCAAACAVAVALDVPMAPFLARLGRTEVPDGRGNRIEVSGIVLFDDSYNANPVSMRYALEALAAQPGRRRVALLGDMLELGAEEAALHAGVAPACAGIDAVICAGPRMADLYDRLPEQRRAGYYATAALLEPEAFAAQLAAGDVVLVKGSKMTFWARHFVARLVAALARRTA